MYTHTNLAVKVTNGLAKNVASCFSWQFKKHHIHATSIIRLYGHITVLCCVKWMRCVDSVNVHLSKTLMCA
uniref:Ovule protein n=1 Tax=Heterorhabditis bacteriophora TaxID=37862 RepID=A0A1I7WDF0_HETBA